VDYSTLKHRVLDMVERSQYGLIEALAEAIAALCLENPTVARVEVRVDKPTALRFARSVGVEITRERKNPLVLAFVSVGSNVYPEENVGHALHLLAREARVVGLSTVYQTEAEGQPEQPPYYNCVVEIETTLSPLALKHAVLRRIEDALGRERSTDKYAPRTIDLDLVVYGDISLQNDDLILPDPQALRRPFVAIPLRELAPGRVLPGAALPIGQAVADLLPAGMQPLDGYTERLRRGLHGPCEPALGGHEPQTVG
jgi:2-amino-4-hydroxy-6-hydroxymethyldihydropteridine diphosphokinase